MLRFLFSLFLLVACCSEALAAEKDIYTIPQDTRTPLERQITEPAPKKVELEVKNPLEFKTGKDTKVEVIPGNPTKVNLSF